MTNINQNGSSIRLKLPYDEEIEQQEKALWNAIEGQENCIFDFLSSTAIIEWINQNSNILKFGEIPQKGSRSYSKLLPSARLSHNLILFDEIHLNVLAIYKTHMDLSGLKSYGFIKEYPRPHFKSFYNMYQSIKPIVFPGLFDLFMETSPPPFDNVWRNEKHKKEFENYRNLISWLYDEYAKDECDMNSNEMYIMGEMVNNYDMEILRFIECAVKSQVSLMLKGIPMFSSILKHSHIEENNKLVNKQIRKDTFALYRYACGNVMGIEPACRTFDQILHLREDKQVVKLRSLLKRYIHALKHSENDIVNELTTEIERRKKEHNKLQFTEHPFYSYTIKPLSLIPGIGQIVTYIDVALEGTNRIFKNKNNLIYFGLR